MKKEEIEPFDLQRILFGQTPGEFMLEVFVRTLIIYVVLLVVLRLMGKRMDGQLTITEFSVMVMLGAIVSVPMQLSERGLLLGIIALLCILALQRGINWLSVRNDKVEELTQGTMSILVKDGILQLEEMHRAGISKQNLFAALRSRQIFNLGKVKRVYFEACGLLNVYTDEADKPGLPLFPDKEMDYVKNSADGETSKIACTNCGFLADNSKEKHNCPNCQTIQWTEAVH